VSGGKEGILSELLRAVLCTTVVHNGMHMHKCEQFLNLRLVTGLVQLLCVYNRSVCIFCVSMLVWITLFFIISYHDHIGNL